MKYLLLLMLLFIGCFKTKTPETYLIPDGYQGNIIIAFEQKKGREEEFEGKRRIYRVDKDGILITKFKSEDGIVDEEYYYIKSDGSRKRIKVDNSKFWIDSSLIKKYLSKNYDSILIRKFGIAGGYTGGKDLSIKVSYSQSTIANGYFYDTADLEKWGDNQWEKIIDKLK